MNERIKQIAWQAGMTDDKFGMFFALHNHNEDGVDLEKFTELIVRECVLISRTSTDGFSAGRRMEEHFGVEE